MSDVKIDDLPYVPTVPITDTGVGIIPILVDFQGDSNFTTYKINADEFLNQPEALASFSAVYANVGTISSLTNDEIHGNFIQMVPTPTVGTGAQITAIYPDIDDTAKLHIYANSVYFDPNAGLGSPLNVFVEGNIVLRESVSGPGNDIYFINDGADLTLAVGDPTGTSYARIICGPQITFIDPADSYSQTFIWHVAPNLEIRSMDFAIHPGLFIRGGLSVFGAAVPTSQTTLNAAATDAATTMALVNQIRAMLITLGFAQ
jgi:hypothetical protein